MKASIAKHTISHSIIFFGSPDMKFNSTQRTAGAIPICSKSVKMFIVCLESLSVVSIVC